MKTSSLVVKGKDAPENTPDTQDSVGLETGLTVDGVFTAWVTGAADVFILAFKAAILCFVWSETGAAGDVCFSLSSAEIILMP